MFTYLNVAPSENSVGCPTTGGLYLANCMTLELNGDGYKCTACASTNSLIAYTDSTTKCLPTSTVWIVVGCKNYTTDTTPVCANCSSDTPNLISAYEETITTKSSKCIANNYVLPGCKTYVYFAAIPATPASDDGLTPAVAAVP
jgi:hypothetical protein